MKLTDVVTPDELLKAIRNLRDKRASANRDIHAARKAVQVFAPAIWEMVDGTSEIFTDDKSDHCATAIALLMAFEHAMERNERAKC